MYDSIKNFNKQFEYQPIIENAEKLVQKNRIIVAGMGGSELAAMLMKEAYPETDFILHRDYNLPRLGDTKLKDSLVIAVSYSGNTEEALDAFGTALAMGVPLAAISTGGKLIELAKQNSVPYIQMPNAGIQPRMALGYSTLSLLKMVGKDNILQDINKLSLKLNTSNYEDSGKQLAEKLFNKIPIVYSSKPNEALAYIWKIKFNETGKIPAFCNIFPELNHNEMSGFSTKDRSASFSCIIIKDQEDDSRIARRMEILTKLYRERGIDVYEIALDGPTRLYKIFSSIVLADWTSFYIAESYGADPEQVPMIEEFKKLIA